jgi:vacuolar-type H+-ATPase subunit B/Vma2
MTRDDHPNVSDQLYANYAIGQAWARSLGKSWGKSWLNMLGLYMEFDGKSLNYI